MSAPAPARRTARLQRAAYESVIDAEAPRSPAVVHLARPTPARARSSTRSRRGMCPSLPRAGGRRADHPRRQGLPAQAVPARTAAGGADLRRRRLVPASRSPTSRRARSRSSTRRKVDEGCPKDCGLCPDHEQHTCLPIIEITNHCNLECPICIVQNQHNYHMTRRGVRRRSSTGWSRRRGRSRRSTSRAASRRSTRSSSSSSTWRARPEISRVSISTNGLRIATDYDFCEELAGRKVYVSLQLDALSNPALRVLRGAGDQQAAKEQGAGQPGARRRAHDDRRRPWPRASTTASIGDASGCSSSSDFILSLMFQPAAYTGYGGAHFAPHDPLDVITIPDVVRARRGADRRAAREERLSAAALLAPGLLRAHLPAQDRRRRSSRSRASSSWSSTSR